jgi:SSS family solute:Na+ symporter
MIAGVHLLDILMVVLYFFLTIIVGLWTAKRIKNESDFLVGGRSMGKVLQIFMNFGGPSIQICLPLQYSG